MIRKLFCSAMLLFGLSAVGCSSPQTFNVMVTNRLPDPITVWMTKEKHEEGQSYEEGWVPPEVLAVGNTESQRLGGVAIQPGETAQTILKGQISGDNVAVLRVYRAADINMILATSHGSPDRLDIPLDPGKTDIDIVRKNGAMAFVPHGRLATKPSP